MAGVNDAYLPDGRSTDGFGGPLSRLAALPVVLVAIPVFLGAGYGLAAWALGAGLWVLNRVIQWATGHFIIGLPQTVAVGVAGVSFISRAWGVLIALLLTVHWGSRSTAVPAAVLFIVLYTIDLFARGLGYAQSRRIRVERPD